MYQQVFFLFTQSIMAGSAPNIRREIDTFNLTVIDSSSRSIYNGCILKIVLQTPKHSETESRKRLEDLLGRPIDPSLYKTRRNRLLKAYHHLTKVLHHEQLWDDFKILLLETWDAAPPRIKRPTSPTVSAPSTSSPPLLPTKKLRSDCEKCPILQAELDNMKTAHAEELTSLTKMYEDKLAALQATNLTLHYDLRDAKQLKWQFKQNWDKRLDTVKKLQHHRRLASQKEKLRASSNPMELRQQLKNARISSSMTLLSSKKKVEAKSTQVHQLESSIRELKKKVRGLELFIDDLECSRASHTTTESPLDEKPAHQYNWRVRKVIYASLNTKVPYCNTAELHQTCLKELAGVDAPRLPAASFAG